MIPVILFAYSRPNHLRETLDCLRTNQIPVIYAFSDGPRTPDKARAVSEVRQVLRSIDWCEVFLCERDENLGLGRSILAGVTEVLEKHETAIIFEDDLVCVPGTYDYLCAALNHYRNDSRVMSVTGWTHPLITPKDIGNQPYFDGRAECGVWGVWARAWQGMEQDAWRLMLACEAQGISRSKYGYDLPAMAEVELDRNIWAVRWLYQHILQGGLCLRPPWSMVEHIGFDAQATNASSAGQWANSPLRSCPLVPLEWPTPLEHPACPGMWQAACPPPPERHRASLAGPIQALKRKLRKVAMSVSGSRRPETLSARDLVRLTAPPLILHGYRALRRAKLSGEPLSTGIRLSGEYSHWDAAVADSTGYAADVILEKTKTSLLKVKRGEAVYERDSVLFDEVQYAWPLLAGLMWVAARNSGRLNVLDFGGSLGSAYFQNRTFLAGLSEVRWNIVEQAAHVEAGKRWFEDEHLKFYASVEGCLAETQPQVIILGSVLQYLEHPYDILDELFATSCNHLIIDRTPFWDGTADRLCIQHVPAAIYSASYPSWIFSAQRFRSILSINWAIIADFNNSDKLPGPVPFAYRGVIAARHKPASAT